MTSDMVETIVHSSNLRTSFFDTGAYVCTNSLIIVIQEIQLG